MFESLALTAPAGRVIVGSAGRCECGTKAPANPSLRSNAFYILDESDSKVLAARNEAIAVPIASSAS
jgi:D-alanyl-D-alanine carboxypeptidase